MQGANERLRRDRSNAFHYTGGPRWFDFWNARVVLPDQRLFFYIMPYILSGTEVPPDRRGLYVYDGGNGGPTVGCHAARERLAAREWSASQDMCDVRWSQLGVEGNEFGVDRIRLVGPTTRWDVRIIPFLTDHYDPQLDERHAEMVQRMLLRRFPFMHQVPYMKGYATGFVEQGGRRHTFERAPFYQAKNHGHTFPEAWTWVHGNAFVEDDNLALEAAALRTTEGREAALVRVARPEGTRLLATWMGDEIRVERSGDRYAFHAVSRDGAFTVTGTGVHGESVRFRFPAPDGSGFENDECLLGVMSAEVQGVTVTTNLAALGRAHRVAGGIASGLPANEMAHKMG